MKGSAKVFTNTLTLYVRLGILSIVSLVTVKLTLQALGETDYGLNNVMSSVVLLSSFITASMSIASQRYFAISLKKGDWFELSRYFSLIFNLFLVFVISAIFIFNTFGIWFVLNRLVIPDSRLFPCLIVYEASLINFAFTVMALPFTGLIIADENFKVFSIISVFDGLAKVIVAFMLYISPWDKLISLALLSLGVSFLTNGLYVVYTKKKYNFLNYKMKQEYSGYKELFSYMNWNLIGAAGSVGKIQGLNIILNMFFGGSVNAARALATQVRSIINSFSSSFMSAVNPQITKSYAGQEYDKLEMLVYSSSKMSFFLLYIIILPFTFNMRYILHLWLGETVPEYTVEFIILILLDMLIQVITSPIGTAIAATGKVRDYQLTVGMLQILNIPAAYLILKITLDPILPFTISIIISVGITIGRIILYRRINSKFNFVKYVKNVFRPILLVVLPSFLLTYLIFCEFDNILMAILFVLLIVSYTVSFVFFFGLNKDEKHFLKEIFTSKLYKK
ncbi:hypothetical protein EXM22_02845 [Oceanispirochaeta crateris]|uniref:Lipopolysaccharide biosynthesis protein n=1 Tax=Oceanispirochaeta crateris TaxID=2518645 RepID=A0A5C1QFY3_9SPIO|nr:MATE family efflux transporter [Oceanispirochaeta crateris]QEN06975.1 hypothetical protein EXM22_02845 [Oceanispirochaeta crateris]